MGEPKFDGSKTESRDRHPLERLVKSFSRAEIESLTVPTLEQNIILPETFYQPTLQFTAVENESRGVMLAREMVTGGKTFCIVEYMQTLGYGDNVSVFPDEQKRQAFIQMLQQHGAGMKVIEYHAHTVGTGSAWQDKFSGGDFKTAEGMLTRNPNYLHVLFTPTNVLTLAVKPTAFKLAKVKPEAKQVALDKFEEWQRIFASFLG